MDGRARRRLVALTLVLVALAAGVYWRLAGPGDGTTRARNAPPGRGPALLAAEQDLTPGAAAAAVEGTVTDADGKPVDGAVVVLARVRSRELLSFAPPRPTAVATSAGGGRFSFAAVAAGRYGVTATAEGWAPAQKEPVEVGVTGTAQVALTLGRGGLVLSGRVLDAGGGAVARATLRAQEVAQNSDPGPPRFFQTAADDGGGYRLHLRRGRFVITVEADGYASVRQFINLSGALTRDFRLMPASRIHGRVVERGTKRPVAGAEVWLQTDRFMGVRPHDVKTDDAGAFAFDDVEPGTYRVSARKGRLVGIGTQVAVAVAETADGVEVEVGPGLVVSGRVLDASGKGLEGARVMLLKFAPPFERPVAAHSAADGAFALEGVLPGRFTVAASLEAHAAAQRPLTVAAADVPKFDLTLAGEARVVGTVVDAQGRPVAGAEVSAGVRPKEMDGAFSTARATTTADGAFELKGLGPGLLALHAEHPEAGSVDPPPEPLEPAARREVKLALAAAASISGTVRDDEGRPVAGAQVRAFLRSVAMMNEVVDTTGTDGRYHLRPLGQGQVVVAATRRGDALPSDNGDRPNRRVLSLDAAEKKDGVDLVVPSGGQAIAGTVVDADGRPVPGAAVTAVLEEREQGVVNAFRGWSTEEKAVTNAEGAFTLEDLGRGNHTLWVTHPSHPELQRRGVVSPSSGLRLTFARSSSLSGVVVDGKGAPAAGYTIALQQAAGANESLEDRSRRTWSSWERPVQRVRDPSAAFSFDRLEAGAYDLRVTGDDGTVGNLTVAVASGEKKRGVRITLETGTRVSGKIVAYEGGAPIPGVEVRAFVPGGAPQTAKSDATGAFAIEGIGAGQTLMVNFMPPPRTYVYDYREVDLAAGKKEVDLGTVRLLKGDIEKKLADAEKATRGSLGIMANNRGAGPVITTLEPNLPAAQAGLKPGDTFLTIDGHDVRDLGGGATRFLFVGTAGSTVDVEYRPAEGGTKKVRLTRVARGK